MLTAGRWEEKNQTLGPFVWSCEGMKSSCGGAAQEGNTGLMKLRRSHRHDGSGLRKMAASLTQHDVGGP